MSTVQDFISMIKTHGSVVTYHRDTDWIPCPCLTPEGFRDPEWHLAHPLEPVCNEAGDLFLSVHRLILQLKDSYSLRKAHG
jgi:hypothetical protein